MSTVFEIPLSAQPQHFSITLGIVQYQMTVTWNTVAQCWVLDIGDINGEPLIQGIPLVTGADLLAQYGYMNFGGQLFAQTDNEPDVIPAYDNLGVDSHLYFVVP